MSKYQLPFTVNTIGRVVTTIKIDISDTAKWEQWFLLSADDHWDNPDSDQDMIRRHLAEAKDKRAGVFKFGDVLCLMQGKYDKRSSKSKVRPEHQHGNYIDRVIDTAADFYGPYSSNIVLISEGNHETSIRERHETDVTTRLVERINALHDGKVVRGGYGGWVKFQFTRGVHRVSRNLKYFHGAGGGGPVTRGVIQTNRQAVYLPDADFVVNGHTHDAWIVPIARERINVAGTVYQDEQMHIRCPSYKDEYKDGNGGWHVERWGPPKPIGAWWLRFFWDGRRELASEITPAK